MVYIHAARTNNELLSLPLFTGMKKEFVVLVNKEGKKIGTAEKLEAHQRGLLHRAFSIFIFNDRGEMLLQKRAPGKYHFADMWSNACCSHPRPGEKILSAAKRRLREELNLQTRLESKGPVRYKFFDAGSQLTEHEYDYIFTGRFNGVVDFNFKEVAGIKWVSNPALKKEIKFQPRRFTPWFLFIMNKLSEQLWS